MNVYRKRVEKIEYIDAPPDRFFANRQFQFSRERSGKQARSSSGATGSARR